MEVDAHRIVKFAVLSILMLAISAASAHEFGAKRYIVYDVQKAKEMNLPLIKETRRFAVTSVKPEGVRYEEDKPVHALFMPDDKFVGNQKYLDSIHAKAAWDYILGNKQIVVAVIDTGVSLFHEDLSKNIWVNRDEIPNNGVDDDGNGYVDDYWGYDFVNRDPTPMDDEGHGTHVAGIIAAEINNLVGIAGISQVKIMPLKVLDANGNGYDSDVAEAIYYAVDNGADVISMSLGGSEYASVLKNACDYAWKHGVIVVAASGNDGESSIDYPAAFSSVIAVGSVDNRNKLSSFSDFGKQQELVAPGESIYSTFLGNSYTYMSGTSMAAPQVSALASLILSMNPSLTGSEVREILHKTADDLGGEGWDEFYGYGKINVSRAVYETPLRKSTSFRDGNSTFTITLSSPRFSSGCIANFSWALRDSNETYSLELTDRFGNVLWKHTITGNGSWSTIINYPRGGYFFRIEGSSEIGELFAISNSGGKFTIVNVSVPNTVILGHVLNATVCVRNDGEGSAYKAGLVVNGKLVSVKDVYVNSESTACLNLSYVVNTTEISVSVNGLQTYNVTVLKPPEFNVTFSVEPKMLDLGENVTVTACAENTGDVGGNATFPLEVDGKIVYNTSVFVESGGVECVNISYAPPGGVHEVRIAFDNLTPVKVTVNVSGDVNGDGKLDFSDLVETLNLVLSNRYSPKADFDGNGVVNFQDLISMLNILLTSRG